MKKKMSVIFMTLLTVMVLATGVMASESAGTDGEEHSIVLIRRVGDFAPEVVSVVYTGIEDGSGLETSDFEITTTNSYGETVTVQPDEITYEEDVLTITLDRGNHLEIKIDSREDNHPEDTDFIVDCTNDELDINYGDLTAVRTLVADDFNFYAITPEEIKETYGFSVKGKEGEQSDFTYYAYEPESTEPLPLVLTLHGGGKDDIQLWDSPMATTFADPAWQEEHPCYVLAPSAKALGWSENGFVVLMDIIDKYIADGKVDPNRLYVLGHSMGGMGTNSAVYYYPDRFAVAFPTSTGAGTGDNHEEFWNTMVSGGTKIWVSGNTLDPTVPIPQTREHYVGLYIASGRNPEQILYTEYSATDIASMGFSKDFEAIEIPGLGKPLYHGGDIVVTHDKDRLEWMFQQSRTELGE